ncbi:MAG: hypothetical protein SGBAC_011789 [Bacillariaceae sp.]
MKLPKLLRSKIFKKQQTNASGGDHMVDVPEEAPSERLESFVYTGESRDKLPLVIIHATVNPWTRKIKKFAFQNSEYLQSMVIPRNVKKIGCEAFKGCTSLVELHLNRGLKCLLREAFHSCRSLTGSEHEGVETLSIPATVDAVGGHAFAYCTSLSNVRFQGGLKRLAEGVFSNCTSLVHVELALGLEVIADGVFSECASLTGIELPQGLEWIGRNAFENCVSLSSVSFPRGLERIGDRSFIGCVSLVEVQFPEGLIAIGRSSFVGCTSLVEAQFPEGLISVYDDAFRGCTALSAIALPSSVDELFFRVFADCTSLVGVEFPVFCTSGRASGYLRRFYPCWSESLFSGCNSLVNVSFPSYVVDETGAFPGCPLLEAYGTGVKDRYARFPVHEVCYNSSSATVDDLIRALDSSEMIEDEFGLTAFHIVATSANPRVEILECLLDRYSFDTLCRRDDNGKTMLDYLLMNTSSKVVPLIMVVLEKAILDRMAPWQNGEMRCSNLAQCLRCIPRDKGIVGADGRRKHVNDCFLRNAGHFMRTEMTSLLELALWKSRLHAAQNDEACTDNNIRQICRLQRGAGVVIENVAKHLWRDETGLALSFFPVCSLTIN